MSAEDVLVSDTEKPITLSTEEEIAVDAVDAVDAVPLAMNERPDSMAPMVPMDSDDESSVLLPPPEESNTEADDVDLEQDPETMREMEVTGTEEVQLEAETPTTTTNIIESESEVRQEPLSPNIYKHSDNELPEDQPLSPEDRENEEHEDRLTLSPLSLALANADDDLVPDGGADTVKTRTKIHERLALELSKHQFSGQRRSPDLVPLTRNYQSFRKQLRSLIAAIKSYKKAMDQAELARSKLFQEYEGMSSSTPLSEYVATALDLQELALIEQSAGLSANEEADPSDGLRLALDDLNAVNYQGVNQAKPTSLASIQQIGQLLAKKTSVEYQKYIIDFASEWHNVVTAMLDREIDLVRQLQRRRIHYERKVGALRKRTNNIENKGKQVPASIADKLLRNEQKLATAWENHEQRAARLCVLLEQVTEHGWKDLLPLIQNTMTLEVNRVARDMTSFGKMKFILEEIASSQLVSVPVTLLYEV